MIARAAEVEAAPRLTRERKRLTSASLVFVPSEGDERALDAKRLADAGAFFRRLGAEVKP